MLQHSLITNLRDLLELTYIKELIQQQNHREALERLAVLIDKYPLDVELQNLHRRCLLPPSFDGLVMMR